ncbi:hypothetical protein [Clostridium peptidivorans]|uniref:hypothetical protein n=1 Tax=Clostridium peptidivorans TaxID=100174 RepID=UPI000BE2BE25|nr:hypothetical protein [Clostridium peptidivorans]
MTLNDLVIEILNKYKEDKKKWGDIFPLQTIENIWIDKFSLSKREVLLYLEKLSKSEFCLPLVKAPVKIHFITLPNWGTKKKYFKIGTLQYTHIELLNGNN